MDLEPIQRKSFTYESTQQECKIMTEMLGHIQIILDTLGAFFQKNNLKNSQKY